MIEIGKLRPNQRAKTPKGHIVIILEHLSRSTIVKVPGWKERLELSKRQMVMPVTEDN